MSARSRRRAIRAVPPDVLADAAGVMGAAYLALCYATEPENWPSFSEYADAIAGNGTLASCPRERAVRLLPLLEQLMWATGQAAGLAGEP